MSEVSKGGLDLDYVNALKDAKMKVFYAQRTSVMSGLAEMSPAYAKGLLAAAVNAGPNEEIFKLAQHIRSLQLK